MFLHDVLIATIPDSDVLYDVFIARVADSDVLYDDCSGCSTRHNKLLYLDRFNLILNYVVIPAFRFKVKCFVVDKSQKTSLKSFAFCRYIRLPAWLSELKNTPP